MDTHAENERDYRIAADDEIARSEAKFRRLFEASHDGILILDADTGEITAANPFLLALLGYTEAEMLGKALWEIGTFRDQETSKIAFHELQRVQAMRYEDLPLQTRDGRTVDVEFVSNVYDVLGEKVIQCNIRDITDRKHAEAETFKNGRVTALRAAVGLALSEANPFPAAFQECAEAFVMHFSTTLAQIWVHELERDTISIVASAGAAAASGASTDGAPPGYSHVRRIVATGEPIIADGVSVEAEDADHLWAIQQGITAFAGYPLKVEGRVVGVLGLFAQDPFADSVLATLNSLPNHLALAIDRWQRSRDVEAAEERLRFAMESAHVGVWDMDYVSGDLQWSTTMESQYGMTPRTFAGTFEAFSAHIHPEDREATLAAIARAERKGKDFSVQHRTLHEDGSIRWLRGEGRFVLDADGKPLRASGVSLDITEQLAIQAQDQQAQKMEAIGRLAGGVAHDFNNLLTVMLGSCELVLTSLTDDDPNRDDIEEIQKAGLRAAALTRQLLTFSRRSVVEPKLLDVNEVLDGLLPMLTRLIGEDVKVVTRLRSAGAHVLADRNQIEQVLVNLAVNARDSMLGGGTLTIESDKIELDENYVSMHFASAPGSYVVLTVTDTGSGMTEDVLKHIFEPFYTTKPLGEGTGLGLATVHGIVLQNGGSIGVYSEVGHGASFKVYLPLVSAADDASVASPPDTKQLGGTETILVVEDSDALRAVTKRMLEQAGYTVVVASSAMEAQTQFENSPGIGLVLTDVVMPGGNGPELIIKLRHRRPGARVIYMSGYSEDAISHHGVLAPGIAFLQKPFSATALRRKLREQLDG